MFHLVNICITYAYIPSVCNACKKNLACISKSKSKEERRTKEEGEDEEEKKKRKKRKEGTIIIL